MSNLSEYNEIKKNIAQKIISDRDCVDLITGTDGMVNLPATSLIETATSKNQVHLYDYLPGITEKANTHVCVEVFDVAASTPAVARYIVTIDIIVPESMMVMNGAIRRDSLAAALDNLFNNQSEWGFGKAERLSGRTWIPIDGFRARTLRYSVDSWNNSGRTMHGK